MEVNCSEVKSHFNLDLLESQISLTGCSTQTAYQVMDDHLDRRLSFLDKFDKEFERLNSEGLPKSNTVSADYTRIVHCDDNLNRAQ